MSDVRYALRAFRANPGLTAIAVLSLAIGIGPNAAIFSFLDALGFRPLAISDASHLMIVRCTGPGNGRRGPCSYPELLDIRDRTRAFSDVVSTNQTGMAITVGHEQASVGFGELVSANYFTLLGVRPITGRTFVADDERSAQPPAVISERVWNTRFNRDPNILGRTIHVNRLDLPVIGVVSSTFVGTGPDISVFATDLWLPDSALDTVYPGSAKNRQDRADRQVKVLMRAHAGVTLAEARNGVEALGRDLARAYPDTTRDRRMTVDYEETLRRKPFVTISALSLSVAGLVLLIACANVAGLLLGRSEARRQEIAVRLAMGASRGRLLRQLLIESALLSAMGAAAGLLLTAWVARMAAALTPASPIPVTLDIRFDARLLAFTLLAACVAVPVFGLTPAWLAARRDVFPILKGSGDASRAGGFRSGLRGVLVAGQFALSLALVVASGLLVRSYVNTNSSDIGFARRPMVFGMVTPPAAGYNNARTQQFFSRLLERLNGTPGVTATALAAHIPLNGLMGGGAMEKVVVPGHEPPAGQPAFAIRRNIVSAGYFNAMGVPLLRGRDFAMSDRRDSVRVAIINQTMAKQFWPNAEAVGQHISLVPDTKEVPPTDCEVVGVARDSKYVSINEPAEPYVYLAYSQTPHGDMSVIVRGQDEAELPAALRSALAEIGPSVPVSQLTTLTEHLHLAMIAERVIAGLVMVVGAIALFLSAIGLYGVVAFAVARRTREIGIRIALGATPMDVIGEVLKQGGKFAAAGTVVGLLLAAAVGRVLANDLYGVSGWDPLTFAGSVVLMGLVVLAASYVPARRAARIDAIAALRCE